MKNKVHRNICEYFLRFIACLFVAFLCWSEVSAKDTPSQMPTGPEFTSSIGMKLVRIEPARFQMGQLKTPLPSEILPLYRGRGRMDFLRDGDFDEKPVHPVTISKPYYIGVSEVTNFQYELFDHRHRVLRGKDGVSRDDDEPVVYVSWYEAQAFCDWLSDQEGLSYRLPTEAEWEYACRAGTTTNYYAGDILPQTLCKNQRAAGRPEPVPTHVGKTPPNNYGICDMHGNVEEWCHDWYGPYQSGLQTDPVGPVAGDFKVTRGGSHGTPVYYLRSANRTGALADDRNPIIGFRVVLGESPDTKPAPMPLSPQNQRNVVKRSSAEVRKGQDPEKPYFSGPRRYVNIPNGTSGPVFAAHNHDPAIVECPNGDLLAVWYTCAAESDRELAQAASRLRWGYDQWEQASPFWDAPDRNDHAPALWADEKGNLYHFSGLAFAGGHYWSAMIMRTSSDSGATWSAARIIVPEYARGGRMPSEPVIRLHDGSIALAVDDRGSGLWMSCDQGLTWTNPPGSIHGIHAGVVQLKDGRLLALGRGNGGMMPQSISYDLGQTYTYSESEFPGIGGGQRLVLMRLREGLIMLAAFADTGIMITDASGSQREVYGLYTAVSTDEGRTWPYRRLVSDDGSGRAVECTDGGLFIMSGRNAEYRGYLAGCQSADGLIHVISSRVHYSFNLKWLMTPPPELRYPPVPVQSVVETFSGPESFDNDGWADYHSYQGEFTKDGKFRIVSLAHHNGINRIVGKGSLEATAKIDNICFYPRGDRVSEGLVILIRDSRARSMSFAVRDNGIDLDYSDNEPGPGAKDARQDPAGRGPEFEPVRYSTPPKSATIRLVYDEPQKHIRVLYGLDGKEPLEEHPRSKAGIIFARALSECTATFILMSNGSIDVDHFEIKAVSP
jgi:formylglycine-generating enzyme required for sulfatase activity